MATQPNRRRGVVGDVCDVGDVGGAGTLCTLCTVCPVHATRAASEPVAGLSVAVLSMAAP